MHERRYRFGTVDLVLSTESAAVDAAVRGLFRHLGVPTAEGPPAPSRVTLELAVGTDGLDVPAGAREVERTSDHVRVWEAGRLTVLSAEAGGGRSVVCYDPDGGRGWGRLHPGLLDDPREVWWRFFIFLVSGLFILLRPHRLYALHAAALGRGDGGLLLVADSDCGKSTLAYSLVREGWSFLSDDTVVLSAGGAAIGALPFRRHFGLDMVAGQFFPELRDTPHLPLAEEDKWVVDVGRQFPGRVAERLRPRVLVFPQIVDADESRVEPVRPSDAHHHLIRQSTLPYWRAGAAKEHLAALARLVGQTRHYRFLGGRDVVRCPARASGLLAPLLDAHA